MQDNYDKFKAAGAELIAISSDNVKATDTTVQNEGLKYPVLSDKDREVITDYNVVDPANNRIARSSSFILMRDGTVAWVTLDEWNVRVPTAKILTELGKL